MEVKKYKRVFVVVIDSLGVGALPDAADYGCRNRYIRTYFSERR